MFNFGNLKSKVKNMNLSREFTCPYCIRKYNLSEVRYVCPDCGKEVEASGKPPYKCKCGGAATEPVCKYSRFVHIVEDFNDITEGEDLFFNCDDLPKKEELETQKIQIEKPGQNGQTVMVETEVITGVRKQAPEQRNVIPKAALETPNLPFSIVGVSGSGKTNFITVMLEELHKKGGSLGLTLLPQNTKTRNHQKENVNNIYQYHSIPDYTKSGAKLPQIWQIRNLKKQHGSTIKSYTFTIFDGAGEDHEKMDATSTECRYINASKAIIITLDPLILQGVKEGGIVDPKIRSASGGDIVEFQHASDIVGSVAMYIKAARGIKDTKMLDIPVAVVLTKFDTILSHPSFAENAAIRNQSLTITNGKFNKGDIDQVDAEIRNWLYAIDEASFIDALASNFKDFVFFGVSSYGSSPEQQGSTPSQIRPHRVLDPILWLFNKFGFID